MRQFLLILVLFGLTEVKAQFVVLPGTAGVADAQMAFDSGDISLDQAFDFSKASITLAGNFNHNLTITSLQSAPQLTLAKLIVNSSSTYTLNQGQVNISQDLLLQSGFISVGSTSKLVYSGANNLSGSETSYINGKLFVKGSGQRTFPIGNTLGYLPVTLEDVKAGDAATEIGFEAVVGSSGISTSAPEIKAVFEDYYWNMSNGNSGSYSGSIIQLSLNGAGNFFLDGDPVVLELDADNNVNNLNGVKSDNVTSILETTPKGQKYALAKSDAVAVNIRRVITPNGDGFNDYLIIDGIDFYAENSVKLVDRWGVVHFSKDNFKNYSALNPADFDFSKLSNGNYICVVEATGVKVNPKMISVIK